MLSALTLLPDLLSTSGEAGEHGEEPDQALEASAGFKERVQSEGPTQFDQRGWEQGRPHLRIVHDHQPLLLDERVAQAVQE